MHSFVQEEEHASQRQGIDSPPSLSPTSSAAILPKNLPVLPEKAVVNDQKPPRTETEKVTTSLAKQTIEPSRVTPRIRTSFLANPAQKPKLAPKNETHSTGHISTKPNVPEVTTVGVEEILQLLVDTSFGIAALAKNIPDVNRVGTQLEEIKDSIEMRRSLIDSSLRYPLTSFTSPISPTPVARTPGSPALPPVPFSKPDSHDAVTLEHWLYELQKAIWVMNQKVNRYRYDPFALLKNVARKKKLQDYVSNVNRAWVNMMLHLSVVISQKSADAAEHAAGNVTKLAVATGAPDWDELNAGDANSLFIQGERYFIGFGVPKSYDTAFKRYQAAAKLNMPEAANMLGYMLENGLGREKDITAAMYWYRAAALKESTDGMNNLARMYEAGRGCEVSHKIAGDLYKRAADKGHLDAMTNYGYLVENGLGRPHNPRLAYEYYKKAADVGYARAENAVGSCYYRGHGIEKDYFQAVLWYRKAANQGYAPAYNNLGICFEQGHGTSKDLSMAKMYYQKAAEARNANGTCNLGYLCLLEHDYIKAMTQFHLAASLGSIDAYYHLGTMYESGCADAHGTVLNSDLNMAQRYYGEAADRAHVKAQIRLATVLICGPPEMQDMDRAYKYLHLAAGPHDRKPSDTSGLPFEEGETASKGDADAQNMLGELFEVGTFPAHDNGPDLATAASWYRKAMQQGHPRATFNLAALYESGQGVPQDLEKALRLYEEAERRGSPDAITRLQELAELASH